MKVAKKLVITLLLISVIMTMLPLSATSNGVIAWGAADISGSDVRIRSGPGTTHSVLTHVNKGDTVVVVERTSSEWFKVNFHGTVGYISVPLLDRDRKAANFNAAGSISGSGVNMRERPDTSSIVLGTYDTGTTMSIIGINEGWYKVQYDSKTGYIRSDLMKVLDRSAAASAGISISSAPDPNRTLGQKIADYAVGFVGTKYVWAGASPSGFDCSGLTSYVYKQHGIKITRNASGQYRDNGVHVSRADLVAGDLVFFSNNGRSVTHVGIYIGDNKYVHASSSRVGVIISNLSNRTLFGAKRVI